MATTRSYSHSNSNTSHHASSPLASSFKSALPLPKALRENRSFANLARFLGIANGDDGDQSPCAEEEEEEYDGQVEEDGGDVVDEESLMWDAQVRSLYT